MEAVAAIIVTVIVFLIFFYGFNKRGPWGVWWPFFLLLLLVVWASALWLIPIGPEYQGVYWIPLFFIAIVFALLLAAAEGEVTDNEIEFYTARGISMIFWVLIGILILAIIAGYFVL